MVVHHEPPTIDLEELRLDPGTTPAQPTPQRPRQRYPAGVPFLRGPVQLSWLARAASLPGKALAVGISLWYRVGLENSMTVRFVSAVRDRFSLNRSSASRGLKALCQAGLVSVQQSPGQVPVVKVIDEPDQ